VTLGATRLDANEPGSLGFRSSNVTVHPGFNETTLANDLAVICLPTAVTTSGEKCHILINVKLISLKTLFIVPTDAHYYKNHRNVKTI